MNQNQAQQDNNESTLKNAAIAALAASSQTPFRTAFKLSLGLALGTMLPGLIIFGGFVTMFLIYMFTR